MDTLTLFTLRGLALGLALGLAAPAAAQTPAFEPATAPPPTEPTEAGMPTTPPGPDLKFQTGAVKIGTVAEATLSSGYAYLADADARFVTEKIWGNLPDPSVIGLILPTKDGEPDGEWGVVVAYNDDGHVDDEDAGELNFDEILESMKADIPAANAERARLGLETLELLGWASPPHYDAATHRIHWAKRLQVQGVPVTSINYDIRVLGRTGYLELVAVGAETELPRMEAGMKELLTQVQFIEGQRYEQYDSSMDKAAAYGVGALVAGKLAAKVGFLAKLGGLLFAFKKIILIAVVALGAGLAKVLGRKKAGDA
jgi:uncharacterized membrane-anchored protein